MNGKPNIGYPLSIVGPEVFVEHKWLSRMRQLEVSLTNIYVFDRRTLNGVTVNRK